MFVLYAGAMLILSLDIPVMLKFISITVFTIIVCYLIYEFIFRRIGFLRPLFGLKYIFSKSREVKSAVEATTCISQNTDSVATLQFPIKIKKS